MLSKATARFFRLQRLRGLTIRNASRKQHIAISDNFRVVVRSRLTFNSQLIALPEHLRDYVILHELAHLSEFNHSKRFHKKIASIYPDYKERETGLKYIVQHSINY